MEITTTFLNSKTITAKATGKTYTILELIFENQSFSMFLPDEITLPSSVFGDTLVLTYAFSIYQNKGNFKIISINKPKTK
jgi:hypothetical protein